MSSWTRLVGDTILSKWIVVALAISICLNGHLLKGIASGIVGVRLAESLGVGFGKGAVRFEDAEEESLASFRMEEVNRKLQTASRLMIQPEAVIALVIPVDQPSATAASTTTPSLSSCPPTPLMDLPHTHVSLPATKWNPSG